MLCRVLTLGAFVLGGGEWAGGCRVLDATQEKVKDAGPTAGPRGSDRRGKHGPGPHQPALRGSFPSTPCCRALRHLQNQKEQCYGSSRPHRSESRATLMPRHHDPRVTPPSPSPTPLVHPVCMRSPGKPVGEHLLWVRHWVEGGLGETARSGPGLVPATGSFRPLGAADVPLQSPGPLLLGTGALPPKQSLGRISFVFTINGCFSRP